MESLSRFHFIGARLRRWRSHLNLSQTEMAKIAGMKQANESKIESGKQYAWMDHIAKWAEAAGVSPEEFLQYDPPVIYNIQSQTGENIAHQIVQNASPAHNELIEALQAQIRTLEEKFEFMQKQSEDRIQDLKSYIRHLGGQQASA